MSDLAVLTLAALGTVVATGLGALPVAVLGAGWTGRSRAGLSGLAAGSMAVASVVGLLEPGIDDGGVGEVALGAGVGLLFLLGVRAAVRGHPATVAHPGRPRGRWTVIGLVLFAHSLPEGFAIGTAFASHTVGLGVFVILAIALQNVPEGTATAVPMQDAGFSAWAQVGGAIATSLPQLPGALVAYALVDSIEPLLPVSFGFAAGAMLGLTVIDLIPEALARRHRRQGFAGILAGGAAMVLLAQVAGV